MSRALSVCLVALALGACGLDPELQGPQPEGAAIARDLWLARTPQASVSGMVLRVVDLGDGRRAAVRTGGTWYEAEPQFVQAAAQAIEQTAGCGIGSVRVLSPVAVAAEVQCGGAPADPTDS